MAPGQTALRRKGSLGRNNVNHHVVHVTVLGLAGITVGKQRCRGEKINNKSSPLPAEPSKMKTVVAFSRNSTMKGITALSKNLTKSPSDEQVVGQICPDDESDVVSSSITKEPQRHVAVWASSESGTIGSVVTFEASLANLEQNITSFELTIAMAEDNKIHHKVALPFGIASLPIKGDECKNGKSMKLDLPVLSLDAAKEINGKLDGYPMIAISPKTKDLPKNKKRTSLLRLFNRQKKAKVPTEAQRTAFEKAYTMDATGDAILRICLEVYEKGSDLEKIFVSRRLRGDAGNEIDSLIPSRKKKNGARNNRNNRRYENETAPFDEAVGGTRKGGEEDYITTGTESMHEGSTTIDGTFDDTFEGTFEGSEEGTNESGTLDETLEEEEGTMEGIYEDFDDDDRSSDSDTYASNEDNVGYFEWRRNINTTTTNNLNCTGGAEVSSPDRTIDDSYTLSFEKKSLESTSSFGATEGSSGLGTKRSNHSSKKKQQIIDADADDQSSAYEFDLFGRKIQISMCGTGSLPSRMKNKGSEKSTMPYCSGSTGHTTGPAIPTRLRGLVRNMKDDMTAISADFFGKSYHIPVCSAMKPDDDYTLVTEEADTLPKEAFPWVDKVCNSSKKATASDAASTFPVIVPDKETLTKMGYTFSTLSDRDAIAPPRIVVSEELEESVEDNNDNINSTSKERRQDKAATTTVRKISSKKDTSIKQKTTLVTKLSSNNSSSQSNKHQQSSTTDQNFSSPTSIRAFPRSTSIVQEKTKRGATQQQVATEINKDGVVQKLFIDFNSTVKNESSSDPLLPDKTAFKFEPYQQQLPCQQQQQQQQAQVPPVIIPRDETVSIGDLTANTLERNINSETRILDQYRRHFGISLGGGERGADPVLGLPVPVAFGGDGFCPGVRPLEVTSSPIRVTSEGNNLLLNTNINKNRSITAKRKKENYFSEYDEYVSLAPQQQLHQPQQQSSSKNSSSSCSISTKKATATLSSLTAKKKEASIITTSSKNNNSSKNDVNLPFHHYQDYDDETPPRIELTINEYKSRESTKTTISNNNTDSSNEKYRSLPGKHKGEGSSNKNIPMNWI
mmetsp:Transcript_11098/g.12708  ORF Transcript_11098/g.12708 Transcript_11098/m.12708 type:complete len:1074 (+) Transcript_11098:192-3413(+)